ncbi:MAG: 30S ribosomal protein S8 [Candidatus Omnitrophica bacterium]|nr:30S ribosomal protein S8 [Candidatus Omnitrophota bacterium]
MAVTDSIADALTIIRNASFAKKEVAEIKNSKVMEAVLKLLKKDGYILNYKLVKDNKQGLLRVYLGYAKDGTPALSGLKRISKPGLRVYKQSDAIPKVYGGLGTAIISTSKGMVTDNDAREAKIGGEVICYAW